MAHAPLLFTAAVVVAMLAVAAASASASAYSVRAADEGLVIGADEYDDVFGLGDMIARRRRRLDDLSAPSPSTNAPSPGTNAAVAPSPDDGSSSPSTSDGAGNGTATTTTGYISYLALSRGSVPCSQRGASYYNCHPGAEANPYSRGCSAITQCRG